MRSIIQGVRRFRADVVEKQRELFTQLARGQHPEALFITCADSRLVPNIITQTDAGDLFVLRNAGNIVPPYSAAGGGEAATIEFALEALDVKHIIVCGHTKCGAMKALVDNGDMSSMPLVKNWLGHAEATRRIVRENYADYQGDALYNIATQEHVLVQIDNLQTHPCVASRLVKGELSLHAWVFKLETGDVFAFSDEGGRFVPLVDSEPDETGTVVFSVGANGREGRRADPTLGTDGAAR